MTIVNNINETLHRVCAWLYPSNLPGLKGTFIARTDDEASLTIAAVCAALITRGGYSGTFEELVATIKQFYGELVYQLCNGFSVDTGFYSIRLKIGGSWDGVNEHFDPVKHPITITFIPRHALREALKHITVNIKGLARAPSWIAEVTDAETGAVNETLTAGEDFIIGGHLVKVTKEEAGCGLFLLGPILPGTVAAETEITKYIENTARKVIARMPSALTPGEYKLVIRTRYSSHTLLKEVRTITSPVLTLS
ncbi:hypothetical protein AGMMS49942_05760 [Spirochaetia bacterium]|nr:hypothetical protein AGMMS49942_05760 [Spirochaetia bacterium]